MERRWTVKTLQKERERVGERERDVALWGH